MKKDSLGHDSSGAGSRGGALIVRSARLGDVAAICGLNGELGYAGSEAQMTIRLQGILASGEQAVFVAEREGTVLGWIQVQLARIIEADLRGEITGLVVTERTRRQGVGAALVQQAEVWTKARGGELLVVRCNQTRTESHRFYERLGYTVAKVQLNFRKKL